MNSAPKTHRHCDQKKHRDPHRWYETHPHPNPLSKGQEHLLSNVFAQFLTTQGIGFRRMDLHRSHCLLY